MGEHGGAYSPPAATGTVFSDVSTSTYLAKWIEQFGREGISNGCGAGSPPPYCPDDAVNRSSMAVFLLRAKHGSSYHPPACNPSSPTFADVACPGPYTDWIEELARESITSGCGGSNYCPDQSVTRGEMAVFLARTFGLP